MLQLSRSISPQAVRQQLKRILASDAFTRSMRMQRFLEFIVEETLEGRAKQLGEYGIGVAVFDRGSDFEPMTDPIVRNDARRLRFKLLEFYRQNSSDAIVIDMPKGGYVPRFSCASVRPHSARSNRIAVLPFEALSHSPEGAIAGRSLCLSLTAGLTNASGVEIVAHSLMGERTMSEFGLSHFIQGTIVQLRDQCRVIVNLVDAQNGTQLWAHEYDAKSEEMFAFHSEIARAITKEVTARLHVPRLELAHAA